MKKSEKGYLYIIIIIAVCSVIPLLIISFYNHPSSDDYGYTIQTYHMWNDTRSIFSTIAAAIKTSKDFWVGWQGLYSSAFVLALQPAIFGEKYYALTGFLTVGSIFGANIYFSIYVLHFKMNTKKLVASAFGCIMSFLMIQWMPSPVQGLYWYNGAMNYTFFYGVLLILLCSIISLYSKASRIGYIVKIIIVSMVGFVLAGGNHVTALVGVVAAFSSCIYCLLKADKKVIIGNAVVFVSMITGFLLNITSPGTKVRQEFFTERPGVIGAIKLAIKTGFEMIDSWMGLSVIICMVIMLPIVVNVIKDNLLRTKFQFRFPLLVLIGSVGGICMMFCPSFYAMGVPGAGRLKNVVYFAFILLLFINEFYITGWLLRRLDSCKDIAAYWKITSAILFVGMIIACGSDSSAYIAVKSLATQEAKQYSDEANLRYAILHESKGEDVVLNSFTVKPELLYFDDIETDGADGKNSAMASYYEVNSVVRFKN